MTARAPRLALCGALLALAALYVAWFHDDRHRVAALLVFALPPLLLAWLAWCGARARFWAGVLALAWFSHGVMSAWSHPETRAFALAEVALSLVAIGAASWQGLRARFGGQRRG
ncbi:DUF2069 domain-containing protein [[Pseudomonas] boreopolis]|uniref:DUF2069 domain-containing protein n=1 Tax=Xanthomonas boreopolis TaxID=86183 RepID=UPI003DA041B5